MCETNNATPAASVVTTAFITALLHWNITDDPCSLPLFSVKHWQTSMCYSGTGDVGHRRFTSGARCCVVQQHTDSLTRTDDTLNRNKEPTRRLRSGVNDANPRHQFVFKSLAEKIVAWHRARPPVLVLKCVCVPEFTRLSRGCGAMNVNVTTWEVRE